MIKAAIFDMYETLVTLFESPRYFGVQIAADLGIDNTRFREPWDASETDRSIGKSTLEETLKQIMMMNQCYSEERLQEISEKRLQVKRDGFRHLHPEIIPMLSELKKRNIKIGLISNCFSEEVVAIRESALIPFFDAVFLSYEQGVQKPDKEIFRRCLAALQTKPEECLYIGDGGSFELETARELGMKPFQATWYLKDGTTQPCKKRDDFLQLAHPLAVMDIL